MRRFLLSALLCSAVLAPTAPAAGLGGTERLRLSAARWYPDQREFRVTIRCNASARLCAGRLHYENVDEEPLAVAQKVRLTPHRATRLTLRQAAGGVTALAHETDEKFGQARIGADSGRVVEGSSDIVARPSCTTGTTLAADGATRIFRLAGFGMFSCRPASAAPPVPIAGEVNTLISIEISDVRLAGDYLAFVSSNSFKCFTTNLYLYDLSRHEVIAEGSTGIGTDDLAQGCENGGVVDRLVLTPAGSLAWILTEATGPSVHTLVAGRQTTVDTSPSIDTHSLALTVPPGAVTWLRDGTLQTAPLP